MSAVEVLSRDMWEEKRGIRSSSGGGGFGRAFLRGVLEAEEEKKYCPKKKKKKKASHSKTSQLACT